MFVFPRQLTHSPGKFYTRYSSKMAAKNTVIAFDLYGTLLSTESIAHELAKIYDEDKAKQLAALWRRYQLEYTWRINSMGRAVSF